MTQASPAGAVANLVRSFNIDEFSKPEFKIQVSGIEHKANITTLNDLSKLDEVTKKLESEGKDPNGEDGIKQYLRAMFPTIKDSYWETENIGVLYAILNECFLFMADVTRATFKELKNFNQGQTETEQ